MLGSTEIIAIVAVVLVLFGARAIPKFARSIGQAKHEFERGVREGGSKEFEESDSAPPAEANTELPSGKRSESDTSDSEATQDRR